MIKVILLGLLLFMVTGYFTAQYFMSRPLYKPGSISSGANALFNTPILNIDTSTWQVEDNVRLHHFSTGSGKNILVIHGGPGFPIEKPLQGLNPLTNNYRFIYYDQRGCGKSSRPIETFSSTNFYQNTQILEKTLGITAQIADIERIRRHLGEGKLIIIGHSFGGFLASLYAAEFPDQVEALILIAPANVLQLPQTEGEDIFETTRKALPADMLADYENYLIRYFDFSSIFEKNEAELKDLNTEFVKFYKIALLAHNQHLPEAPSSNNGGWMVQAMYMSMGKKHDYRPALKKVKAPVLVIQGENDIHGNVSGRIYADLFPNAQMKIIKGSGHFPYSEQPDIFSRIVGEFLQQL